MEKKYRIVSTAVLVLLLGQVSQAGAATPADFLQQFASEASESEPAFAGFSSRRGEQLFSATHGNDWSCASCHTRDPRQPGEHARTGKRIDPLAPTVNAERFTSERQVSKWFRRNCNDVLGRACSAREKGDVLTYLLSLQP